MVQAKQTNRSIISFRFRIPVALPSKIETPPHTGELVHQKGRFCATPNPLKTAWNKGLSAPGGLGGEGSASSPAGTGRVEVKRGGNSTTR
jgi:hypothetical protein